MNGGGDSGGGSVGDSDGSVGGGHGFDGVVTVAVLVVVVVMVVVVVLVVVVALVKVVLVVVSAAAASKLHPLKPTDRKASVASWYAIAQTGPFIMKVRSDPLFRHFKPPVVDRLNWNVRFELGCLPQGIVNYHLCPGTKLFYD